MEDTKDYIINLITRLFKSEEDTWEYYVGNISRYCIFICTWVGGKRDEEDCSNLNYTIQLFLFKNWYQSDSHISYIMRTTVAQVLGTFINPRHPSTALLYVSSQLNL